MELPDQVSRAGLLRYHCTLDSPGDLVKMHILIQQFAHGARDSAFLICTQVRMLLPLRTQLRTKYLRFSAYFSYKVSNFHTNLTEFLMSTAFVTWH